jgi:CTP synthase (UTP-ammonia lyase)
MTNKIAVLGDFDPTYKTLQAINNTFVPIRKYFNHDIKFDWFDTDQFDFQKAFTDGYSGLWITPGSPYRDMENVLNAIAYTRKNRIPTFGNCGGFQHMAIEFARNVCGIKAADHGETNPAGNDLVIVKLACSLVDQSEELRIIRKDSLLRQIMGRDVFTGKYFCSYGLNDQYLKKIESNGLVFTAESEDGQARAFELRDHPFFLGTLFQPAMASDEKEVNPLIVEFVRRCVGSDE